MDSVRVGPPGVKWGRCRRLPGPTIGSMGNAGPGGAGNGAVGPAELEVPEPSLVVLIGASGSGKSTWAARHFGTYEVVSSDRCRAMIADSEADQSVTPAAFELLRHIVRERLRAGRVAVVDATNVEGAGRLRNLELAAECGVPAVAVVLDLPVERLLANNAGRTGRVVAEDVVREQRRELDEAIPVLGREGYAAVHILDEAAAEVTTVVRRPGRSAQG